MSEAAESPPRSLTPSFSPRRAVAAAWRPLAVAILVAALLDAAFSFVAYVLVAGRYNFETLLQYIASGLAGRSAFASGWAGFGYAAFGLAIHLAVTVGFVVLYWVAIAPWVRTRAAATVVGLTYGVGIWLFMNAVVLPLGRSTHEAFFNGYYTAFLIDHALFVGLPIALALLGRAPRRDAT
jgi:hypothetical protein